jgi:pyruvate,water dikinase
MAVVVQEMVQADAAGVMFTVDPLTRVSTKMTIAASYGLGEVLVSGQVTPDTYTITKKDLSIFQRNIGRKEIKVIQQGNGTTVVAVTGTEQLRPCLLDSRIVEIARIGLDVERHYGQAQDIEWAVWDNHIYILQARAVTGALKAIPPKPLKFLVVQKISMDGYTWVAFHVRRAELSQISFGTISPAPYVHSTSIPA